MKRKLLFLSAVTAILASANAYAVGTTGGTNNLDVGKTIKKNYENKLEAEKVKTHVVIEEIEVEETKKVESAKETINTPIKRSEVRTKVLEKPFEPSGTFGFTQTFYGNSGDYKTATSHPSFTFDLNFAPKWSISLEWDRLMNIYDGGWNSSRPDNYANNNYSSPQGQLTYSHGKLWDTDIIWTANAGARQYNYFTPTENNVYLWANMTFDFYKYFPKYEWLTVSQFALMPMYNYAFFPNSTPGHMNHMSLNLLTQYQLPAGWSLQLDAFFMKEFYTGDYRVGGDSAEELNYFSFYAWLEYSKQIYKFNDKANLTFNFAGGFDPYTISNKSNSGWLPPFWLLSNSYEWLSPTATGNGNYDSIWTIFMLPQLMVNYQYSENLSMNLFAQVKYSNQVWGGESSDWELQPQGGFGFSYSF